MCEADDYLKMGPYRLLPAALDLNRFSEPQITAADRATHDEVDPCLRASVQYIIAQDRYIMDVEMQNHRYRDLLFCCDEEFLKVERKEGEIVGKLEEKRMGYDRMKTFYENREQSLRKEIANLKDKVGEAELLHDHLESKVLECKDQIERQRLTLREFHEKEKHHGIRKLALEARCNTIEKLAVEAAVTTTYNMHHLVHYIKSTEYLHHLQHAPPSRASARLGSTLIASASRRSGRSRTSYYLGCARNHVDSLSTLRPPSSTSKLARLRVTQRFQGLRCWTTLSPTS
jgi:hypothetical protein